MKKTYLKIAITILFSGYFFSSQAQYDCSSAVRLRIPNNTSSTSISDTFALSSPGTPAQSGPAYGCLSNPNRPVWGYFAVCENFSGGSVEFQISFSDSSVNVDTIGVIVWGPFFDKSAVCTQLTASKIIYCQDNIADEAISFFEIFINNTNVPRGLYYYMISVKDENTHPNVVIRNSHYSGFGGANPDDSCNICNNKVSYLEDEHLCVVTVDSLSGKNKLIWEKNYNKGIARYDLYKEGFTAGTFDLMASIPFTSLSEYTDVSSNPVQQSYKYNLIPVDSCNYSLEYYYKYYYHTTIHLLSYPGGNNEAGLLWNNYAGAFANITGTTYIYRNNQLIDSVPSSITTYTDVNAPAGANAYAVEQKLIAACSPARLSSASYFSTRSNLSQVIITGLADTGHQLFDFNIKPNPAIGYTTVTLTLEKPGQVKMEVINSYGQVMEIQKIFFQKGSQLLSFDSAKLPSGIYFIRLHAAGNVGIGKMVKME